MSDLAQRYFDKTIAVRLILGVAACLVAGCLQPSPVSEADTEFIPEVPPEIDTSLYQVGDSWVYQTKTEYFDPYHIEAHIETSRKPGCSRKTVGLYLNH